MSRFARVRFDNFPSADTRVGWKEFALLGVLASGFGLMVGAGGKIGSDYFAAVAQVLPVLYLASWVEVGFVLAVFVRNENDAAERIEHLFEQSKIEKLSASEEAELAQVTAMGARLPARATQGRTRLQRLAGQAFVVTAIGEVVALGALGGSDYNNAYVVVTIGSVFALGFTMYQLLNLRFSMHGETPLAKFAPHA